MFTDNNGVKSGSLGPYDCEMTSRLCSNWCSDWTVSTPVAYLRCSKCGLGITGRHGALSTGDFGGTVNCGVQQIKQLGC